jgi:catechol-2,3-dioxygenase
MQIYELGHVVLYVSDINRSAAFYSRTLGFRQILAGGPMAMFSSGRTHHELLLLEIGAEPETRRAPKPGLYHIGFKVANSHEELKAVYRELQDAGVPIVGLADHGVTHSIYVLDPDGNELELYADVSDEWKTNPEAIAVPTKPLSLD